MTDWPTTCKHVLIWPWRCWACPSAGGTLKEEKGTQDFCFGCQDFVSGQEGEKLASHLGSSPSLLLCLGPSSYLSTYRGVCQTPSLSIWPVASLCIHHITVLDRKPLLCSRHQIQLKIGLFYTAVDTTRCNTNLLGKMWHDSYGAI